MHSFKIVSFKDTDILENVIDVKNFLAIAIFDGQDRIEIKFDEISKTIEVRGSHNITITPHSANVITIGTKLP
jgi:hypothetical protein